MAEGKKSFVLYSDQRSIIDMLPNDKAGILLKHIFAYVNDENPINDDPLILLAFEPIKLQLKRDLVKWADTKKGRSEAGKASAEARRLAKEGQQTSTNSTNVNFVQQSSTNPTVNDNVNVNDTVINISSTPKGVDINFEILLKTINDTFGRKFTVITEPVKKKYKAVLKQGYQKINILTAIETCKKDKYHIETGYKYCTLEYFSRPKTLDLYGTVPTEITTAPRLTMITIADHD